MLRLEENTSQLSVQSDSFRSSSPSLRSEPSGSSLRHSISQRPDTAFEGNNALLSKPFGFCATDALDDCKRIAISRSSSLAAASDDCHTNERSSQQWPQTVDTPTSEAVCKAALHSHHVRPKPPDRVIGRSQPSPKTRQLAHSMHS